MGSTILHSREAYMIRHSSLTPRPLSHHSGPLLPRASPNAASEGPEQPDGDTYNFVKCTNDYTCEWRGEHSLLRAKRRRLSFLQFRSPVSPFSVLPTENYGTVTASSTPDAEAQCAALAEPVSYNFAVQQIGANTWACGSSGHYPSFYTEAECTGQNFSLYLSDQSP